MNERATELWLAAAAGLAAWALARPRRQARYDFRNQVVVLTGGSRGLGLVMARKLADQGARLALCARDRDELDRAADDVAQHGPRPLIAPCDVTDPDSVHGLARTVEASLGPPDVLINNAGVIQVGPLETMTRADFEEALRSNFWGAYNTVEAFLPAMRRRGSGRIVNVASIGGKVSIPHLLPYSVSKFALVGYSHGLRAELAPQGIVVTTICPGLMRTGSPLHGQFKGRHEEEYAWFKVSDSLPLLTISAEEAADAILEACRRGDAEAILSVPAKLAVTAQALFPEWVSGLIELAARLLPPPGPGGAEAVEGKHLEGLAPAWLTALTDQAAAQNNELPPSERWPGGKVP